jgi:nitroimidazol reductase NimA-like FMN-containing flavoprotein (pyridoxamine 5'-phosphate oxidase superfamily)
MLDNFVESREEMEAILKEMSVGFLGMSADGESYVVPLNYAYTDGRILFHCALDGKKLDYLSANPAVCFAVARQRADEVRRHGAGDACHADCDSVICYGVARIIEDREERRGILNAFNRHFRRDADDIALEEVARCGAVEIVVSEMTGRRERNRELTCWRYHFAE